MLPDKPMNSFFQGIIGLSMVYFCGWFFHDLPANNGLLETLDRAGAHHNAVGSLKILADLVDEGERQR